MPEGVISPGTPGNFLARRAGKPHCRRKNNIARTRRQLEIARWTKTTLRRIP